MEKAFEPDHPDVAQSLNTLVELYRVQGRNQEADRLLRERGSDVRAGRFTTYSQHHQTDLYRERSAFIGIGFLADVAPTAAVGRKRRIVEK
jgi:hypothetical protein